MTAGYGMSIGCKCCCTLGTIPRPGQYANDTLRLAAGWEPVDDSDLYRFTKITLPKTDWQIFGTPGAPPQIIYPITAISGDQTLLEIRGAETGNLLLRVSKHLRLEGITGVPPKMVLSFTVEDQEPIDFVRSRISTVSLPLKADGASSGFNVGYPEGPAKWSGSGFPSSGDYPTSYEFARLARRANSIYLEFYAQQNSYFGTVPTVVQWIRDSTDWELHQPNADPTHLIRYFTHAVSQEFASFPVLQEWDEELEFFTTNQLARNLLVGRIGTADRLNTYVNGQSFAMQAKTTPVRCANPGYTPAMPDLYTLPDWDVSLVIPGATAPATTSQRHYGYGVGSESTDNPGNLYSSIDFLQNFSLIDVDARNDFESLLPESEQFVHEAHRANNYRDVRTTYFSTPINTYVPPDTTRSHNSPLAIRTASVSVRVERVFPDLSPEAVAILTANSLTVRSLQTYFGQQRSLDNLVGMTEEISDEILAGFAIADTMLKVNCYLTLSGVGSLAEVESQQVSNHYTTASQNWFQPVSFVGLPTIVQIISFSKIIDRWSGGLPEVRFGYDDITDIFHPGVYWTTSYQWTTHNVTNLQYNGLNGARSWDADVLNELTGSDPIESIEVVLTQPTTRTQAEFTTP